MGGSAWSTVDGFQLHIEVKPLAVVAVRGTAEADFGRGKEMLKVQESPK